MFPDADRPPADPIGHLGANPNNPAVGGFWARNPQAQVSTARGLPNGAWPTERSDVAWQETLEFAEDSAALDANGVHLYLPDHEEYRPVAGSREHEHGDGVHLLGPSPLASVLERHGHHGVGGSARGV